MNTLPEPSLKSKTESWYSRWALVVGLTWGILSWFWFVGIGYRIDTSEELAWLCMHVHHKAWPFAVAGLLLALDYGRLWEMRLRVGFAVIFAAIIFLGAALLSWYGYFSHTISRGGNPIKMLQQGFEK